MKDGNGNGESDSQSELETLRRENTKLHKINKALMGQVERSMDFQGNAFSLFQTAIGLENRVGERTRQLETVLAELEQSNRALKLAKDEAETAKTRLALSIETISEGFALFDSQDRLIQHNSKFLEMWPFDAEFVQIGVTFEEILRSTVAEGFIMGARFNPETWIAERLSLHHTPGNPTVLQLATGRWLQVSERRTSDGGVVSIYTDITEIKLSERRRRERELAEKSILLQATIDNIDHGVSVFDSHKRLIAWNDKFANLTGLDGTKLLPGKPMSAFHLDSSSEMQLEDQSALFFNLHEIAEGDEKSVHFEHHCQSGRILDVRRNPMPDDGFVVTYIDITPRKRVEEALRDSERRMRLVTDAMPALIAYVDQEQRYRFTNKAYETWFNRPRSEINGRFMREVLGLELYDKREFYVERALNGEFVSFEMSLPTDELAIEYALATYVPHVSQDGEVVGFFALIQDITDRKRSADALEEAKLNLEKRVVERTAELMTVNSELADAKAEAEKANISKTRFLAAASHDLLQPLNAARVFMAALAERDLEAEISGFVRNVTIALEAVDELLTALLEISKLDAGVLSVEEHDFKIGPQLWALANEHAPMAQNKGLRLSAANSSAVVRTDPKLLARILRNFLSNAIRYTASGRILIGTRHLKHAVRVGVWDTGDGIPDDKLDEIFLEFRRLPNDSPSENGVGLGLAIVERITKRLGIPVVVQSDVGKGTMFAVDIPYGDPSAVKVDAIEPIRRGSDALAKAVILLIDNEDAILEAMDALLSNWKCTVLKAKTGAQAQEVVTKQEAPHLILADYHLDDEEIGLDAVQRVREYLGIKIPAIVITADRSPAVRKQVEDIDAYILNKPLKPAKLRSLASHILASQEKEDQS